jgi:Contractile injection system tube protein
VSGFPGSPRLLKGALVVFESSLPVPTNVIVFQYNPDSVTRNLRTENGDEGAAPWMRSGDTQNVLPPVERLSMTIELDATDELERGADLAVTTGVHPALAALELLLYPSSKQILDAKALSLFGSAFVRPAHAPLVLLEWGPLRVIPVRVESLAIVEQAFDQLLNPIRASVDVGLRTLTEAELQDAGRLFQAADLVNLIAKEGLAHAQVASAGISALEGLL